MQCLEALCRKALPMLAGAQVAAKAGVLPSEVGGVVVWGNHSAAQFPDVRRARVRQQPLAEVLGSGAEEWMSGELITQVQQRGQTIMQVSPDQAQECDSVGWVDGWRSGRTCTGVGCPAASGLHMTTRKFS